MGMDNAGVIVIIMAVITFFVTTDMWYNLKTVRTVTTKRYFRAIIGMEILAWSFILVGLYFKFYSKGG